MEKIETIIKFSFRSICLRYVLLIFIAIFPIFFIKNISFSTSLEFFYIYYYLMFENLTKLVYFITIMIGTLLFRETFLPYVYWELTQNEYNICVIVMKKIFIFFNFCEENDDSFEMKCAIIMLNFINFLIILFFMKIPFFINFFIKNWEYIFIILFLMGILEYCSYKIMCKSKNDRNRLLIEGVFRILIFFIVITNIIFIVQNTSL